MSEDEKTEGTFVDPVKPPLSTAAIAGAMLCAGSVMAFRGGVYLLGFIKREAHWVS